MLCRANAHTQHPQGVAFAELGILRDVFKQCHLYLGLSNSDIQNFIFTCLIEERALATCEQCGSYEETAFSEKNVSI